MKKIISLLVLTFALVICLASCGHEHTFGEWTVVEKPTYSNDGSESRSCTGCEEKETRTVDALGDEGVYEYLNGHWKEYGSTEGDNFDIYFEDSRFTAKVYIGGSEWGYLGGSGTVEIDEDRITLKEDDGDTYIYFIYEIGNGAMALIDPYIKSWEKYEPTID